MNYTLHQLSIFKRVAELKSITRTAEEMYLSQPAISIQLKKLQDYFPQPLFEIIGRQFYLTEFGEGVLEYAQKILSGVEDLNLHTRSNDGQLVGKLKIALVSTAKYVMPYFLSDFLKNNSEVTLAMEVTNKASVIESLERNRVDFALVSVIPDNQKINSVTLMQNKLFLVGGKNHKIEESRLDVQELSSMPLVFREFGSATRHAMETYLKKRSIDYTMKLELTSNEAIKQAIIAGLGYSVMPLIGIKNELETGDIKIIPIDGLPVITNWNLIWLQSKKLSRTAQAYVDYLKNGKDSIIDKSFSWFEKY